MARLLGLLICSTLALACTRSPAARDVLLVTLDTTRADRLGAYGHAAAETPVIDALAARGLLFDDASAPTPITLPSHVSILSGTWPSAHGVHDNGLFVLAPRARLLPEVLREHGFRTGAFVGSYVLDARFGLDQGFEVYDDPPSTRAAASRGGANRPAAAVVDAALAWIAGLRDDERFFAWVHFYDPHHPYEAHAPWSQRGLAPYDSEIAYCDAELGRLLEGIAGRGRDRDLLVVLTADHGESLGEHGEDTHGVFAYQATLHVPLVLAGPGLGERTGRRSGAPVTNAAIPRTVLELLGLPTEELPDALPESLLAQADDPGRAATAPRYLESYLPYHSYRWHALRGVRRGAHKLIEGVAPELYDLAADPHEQTDLAARAPERVAGLQRLLADTLASHPPLGWVEELDVTSEEEARLEALGYVVGDRGADPFDPDLPAPSERMQDVRLLEEARTLFEEAQQARAWALGEEAVTRRLRAAAERIERVRRANPRDPEALSRLGAVRLQLGETREAARLLEQAVASQPRKGTIYLNLATVYAMLERSDDAVAVARAGIERTPDRRLLALWLQRFHAERGEREAARAVASLLPHGSEDREVVEAAGRRLEAAGPR